ncbi:MAG: hypothetical protein U1F43_00870 [Myxococcota bacterium]
MGAEARRVDASVGSAWGAGRGRSSRGRAGRRIGRAAGLDQRGEGVGPRGRGAGERDAEGVEVGARAGQAARAVGRALGELGREVAAGAAEVAASRAEGAGQAEVDEHRPGAVRAGGRGGAGDDDVGRLEVAVDQAARVEPGQRGQQIGRQALDGVGLGRGREPAVEALADHHVEVIHQVEAPPSVARPRSRTRTTPG